MLYISKWKAIGDPAHGVRSFCLFAVPNFFPRARSSAGRNGRSATSCSASICRAAPHILLEVDANDVRRQKLAALHDDVRRMLREARDRSHRRSGHPRQLRSRCVIRESDLQQGLTKLRELSQPLGGFSAATGAALGRRRECRRRAGAAHA